MSGSFLIPEYVNGIPTFVPFREDIQRKLREGDPTIGWEGDPQLFISPNPKGGWLVGRRSEDGSQQVICFSKPPHRLDEGLLVQLRDHDTRKVNVLERIETNNARLHKENDTRAIEKLSEGMERVVWGLKRDVGHHY